MRFNLPQANSHTRPTSDTRVRRFPLFLSKLIGHLYANGFIFRVSPARLRSHARDAEMDRSYRARENFTTTYANWFRGPRRNLLLFYPRACRNIVLLGRIGIKDDNLGERKNLTPLWESAVNTEAFSVRSTLTRISCVIFIARGSQ